jgi:ribosomal protein S18 acetylase RimI-like enzyme
MRLTSGKDPMTVTLRGAQLPDLEFLREMLYQAVFWRPRPDKPSFEEGLAFPEVQKALAAWGERSGDTAVIATVDSRPVGAAWARLWTDEDHIIGYVDERTPILGVAVREGYRRQGIGRRLIEWMIQRAAEDGIPQISLSVSKDNHALALYRALGFEQTVDRGDAFTMVRRI